MTFHAVTIRDPSDLRLDDYRTLRDPELRKRYENRTGVFIAEGPNVVRELLSSSYRTKSVLVATERFDSMADAFEDDTDVFVADREVIMEVVDFRMHQGVVAVGWRREQLPTVPKVLSADLTMVLEAMNDTANLGALFRTSRALGVGGVVMGPQCSDPLYRRSVRVSMGHVLHLPWTVAPSMQAIWDAAATIGVTTAALVTDDADLTLDELAADRPERVAIVLGAEGPGLTPEAIAACNVRVRIPMAAGVDSLNVAVAGAIAAHVLRPWSSSVTREG